MANFDEAGSLQVCRLRVAALDVDGVPLPGAGNLYVSKALVRLGWDPEIRAGDDFEQVSGCGEVCVSYQDCDQLKRLNTEMEICTPDPELVELLVGGSTITSGGATIGYAYPDTGVAPCPNGVSVEAWSKAIVDDELAATYPYWRWVFPRTKWRLAAGELANAVKTTSLVGRASQNGNWYNGPANDWPYESGKVLQYARDDDMPAITNGAVALAAS